jgi:hypothetical protein
MQSDRVIQLHPACEPEWVALNELVSYCAKSVPASAADSASDPAAVPGVPRCAHASCLFRMRG